MVFTLQVLKKNWDQNGVRGQATKQRAVLSYIVLVMFVHENLGAYSRIGFHKAAHIALFAHWGDSVNAIKFASDNVAEAVGSLSRCLNVCLKVLLPGAGWLNVWTAVNRWIALLFWSTVSSFSFCYQVSEKDCMKNDHMRTCHWLRLYSCPQFISSMHSASTGLFKTRSKCFP